MPKPKALSRSQSVHWYSKEEWKNVYNLIFGPESDEKSKRTALQIFLVWKMRNPYLPSGIESTLSLLEVDLKNPADGSDPMVSDRLLRLMYSSVIMRFINHTLDDAQSKRYTLFQAADRLEIPQWIVDLRHETAHGHELPSLEILKSAACFAINWLYNAYWEPHYSKISNFTTETYSSYFKDNLTKLLNLYNSLTLCRYSDFNMKTIRDIPDKEIRANLLQDMQSIFKDETLNHRTLLNDASNMLINVIISFLDDYKNVPQYGIIFADLMVESESLFMTYDSIELCPVDPDNKLLPEKWVILWEPLLTLLHKKDIVSDLLFVLLKIVKNNNEMESRRKMASQWIREICIRLKNVVKLNIYKPRNEIKSISDDSLKSIYKKKRPDIKGLVLDLNHQVPSDIASIDFLENCLMQIHPYLNIYARSVLDLLEESVPKEARQKLIQLVDIVSNDNLEHPLCDQIYTLDDVKNVHSTMCTLNDGETNAPTDHYTTANKETVNMCTDNYGVWTKASDDYDWGMYPIGMLPWQSKSTNNPLL